MTDNPCSPLAIRAGVASEALPALFRSPASLLLQGTATHKKSPCIPQSRLFPVSFSLLGTHQILCSGAAEAPDFECWAGADLQTPCEELLSHPHELCRQRGGWWGEGLRSR